MMDNSDYAMLCEIANRLDKLRLLKPVSPRKEAQYGHHCLSARGFGLLASLEEEIGINEVIPYMSRSSAADEPMPEGPTKNLIRMLAGPNAAAVFAAFKLKREHEKAKNRHIQGKGDAAEGEENHLQASD